METEHLKLILQALQQEEITIDEAIERLRFLPFDDLGFAHVDTHRRLRKGFPEVILGEGKKMEHVLAIVGSLYRETKTNIMVTRCPIAMADALREQYPEAIYYADARILGLRRSHEIHGQGSIMVITAGTLDIPVAEEAAITAELMGNQVERIFDVGIAGIHRLLHYRERLIKAKVIIVVAGMEGALPSVVSGLVPIPVIAVPTSIGYGTSFGGISALLAMLNSCASGVVVVNIDNGFGAAYAASLINHHHS